MKKTSAFTLIETMIALVISIISVGAIYSSYLFFKDSYQTILDKAEVNNFGRVAIPMITKDLRNTGYIDVNFTREPNPEWRLIELVQKNLDGTDKLVVYQGTTPNSWIRIINSGVILSFS